MCCSLCYRIIQFAKHSTGGGTSSFMTVFGDVICAIGLTVCCYDGSHNPFFKWLFFNQSNDLLQTALVAFSNCPCHGLLLKFLLESFGMFLLNSFGMFLLNSFGMFLLNSFGMFLLNSFGISVFDSVCPQNA